MIRRPGPLFVLLLAGSLALAPGCLSDEQADGDASDGAGPGMDEDTYEECQSHRFSGTSASGSWNAAEIDCRANVPGEDRQEIDCPRPEEAELTISTELTSGQVHLLVEDADAQRIVDRNFGDTGGEPRNVTMQTSDAAPGSWTVTTERPEGFEGEFRVELFCP